jgi:PQQ-like domain
MKPLKNKILATTIVILFALSTIASAALIGTASAHNPSVTIPNYVYLNASPTPDAVGQPISLFAWTAALPPTANGEYGDRWTGLMINVIKPDGTNDTMGPFTSDPVGTIFEHYTPEAVGNYTFQFFMPAYKITNANPNPNGLYGPTNQPSIFLNDTMSAASSTTVTVEVLSSADIAQAPVYPIPSEYWSNPVSQSGHVVNWVYLMGDWLANGIVLANINDYTQAVKSSHIMWTTPITINGGVGTQPSAISSETDAYYSYLSYETNFNPGIIINGVLFYNTAVPPEYGFKAVDIRTGQTLWYNNGTQDPLAVKQPYGGFAKQNYPQLSFGQDLVYGSPNQSGELSYLWATYSMSNGSTVWAMYDPGSGNWIMDIVGVPSGGMANVPDSNGNYIIYTLNAGAKTLSVFNDTQCILADAASASQTNGYWMWRPQLGGQIPASWGTTVYNLTGSIPANIAQDNLEYVDSVNQIAIYGNVSYGISGSQGTINYPSPSAYSMVAISINPSTIGQVLWNQVYTYPQGLTLNTATNAIGNGVFATFVKETTTWYGYSETTGNKLWDTSATPEIGNHMYDASYTGAETTGFFYRGMLIQGDGSGSGGTVYAYNMTTGQLMWTYQSPSMGDTGYWANVPTVFGAGGDNNLYFYGSEHSPNAPLEPGMKLIDIDAATGLQVWNITFWDAGGAKFAMADGYGLALNAYDNQIYSFGKGPTATTVQTPLAGVTEGQGFTVQGTVTDVSAGAKQSSIAARFPNGLPAVSDGSETAWMEYVYMQNPKPTSTKGVDVNLEAIDPNGNTVNLGTATTDASGTYVFTVTPSMLTAGAGTYKILATFSGTNSYWQSSSEAGVTLNAAASTITPVPQQATLTSTDLMTYIVGAVVAIIIALAIATVLILRKRP